MPFEFCIPTKSTIVPDGSEWPHEIKYDGYRLRLERDGDRVRLITRSNDSIGAAGPCPAAISASRLTASTSNPAASPSRSIQRKVIFDRPLSVSG